MSKIRELNLLPQHIKGEKDSKDKLSKYIAIGVLVACAVGGAALYLNGRVTDLEKQKKELTQELEKTEERVNENNEMNQRIQEIEAQINKIDKLSVLKKKNTKDIITQLCKKVPKGMKLTDFTFTTKEEDVKDGYLGELQMSGGSKNRSDIEEFWANLREDKRYYIAHVSGIEKQEDPETKVDFYTFKLAMKIKEN